MGSGHLVINYNKYQTFNVKQHSLFFSLKLKSTSLQNEEQQVREDRDGLEITCIFMTALSLCNAQFDTKFTQLLKESEKYALHQISLNETHL